MATKNAKQFQPCRVMSLQIAQSKKNNNVMGALVYITLLLE